MSRGALESAGDKPPDKDRGKLKYKQINYKDLQLE